MRWQIEVKLRPHVVDSLGLKIEKELEGHAAGVRVRTARLYLLVGDLGPEGAESLARELLSDPVSEEFSLGPWESHGGQIPRSIAVFKKPGVMDPAEANILRGAAILGHPLEQARTGIRYEFEGLLKKQIKRLGRSHLANEALERIQLGCDRFPAEESPARWYFDRVLVPLEDLEDEDLLAISQGSGLSLSLLEMRAIQEYFEDLDRAPTDVELETLAQTWSEHCKHKTFTSPIIYEGPAVGSLAQGARIPNLLDATVKDATLRLDRSFCLSVFHDNAGVIAFDQDLALCFKVETHNHPSAIEPYGGAGTGIGGVIRDILGTGLGARPVANVDVFCVGPLDVAANALPHGTLHPLRVLRGVVSGVRDYGNQMGIPTVSGAVFFDERYLGNPLVYAGTIGILPRDKVQKQVSPGDLIVALGGRTGRDGMHGATFSSVELHEDSEKLDSGAVQIGNAITEKKLADVLLEARDRGLFSAVTDCGAGGFSSAVGEMGASCGARVHLERAPLKYAGLSPTEIWISEAQERMVLAVPPKRGDELLDLCRSEDVEAVILGTFTDTGRLELLYADEIVADLDMQFMHEGLPLEERHATYTPPQRQDNRLADLPAADATLLKILGSPAVASKEWIIRQYDHEVQGTSVVKPLVGTRGQGPSDGAVLAPVLGSTVGFAVGLGMNPALGDLDPYAMATAAVDEALRNVVCVGADPDHCAILDNFSWGNCHKADRLGGLVRAAHGCRDAALALHTPFISGKDSLNNEYRVGKRTIVIPPSLLISALARVPDVRRAVSMDLKAAGNLLYVVGATACELGGSQVLALLGRQGSRPLQFHGERARLIFKALHAAMCAGLVRACHDLSEGGLAVSAAEMVLAGELGARISLQALPLDEEDLNDVELAFSESLSRFLVEVPEASAQAFEQQLTGLPCARVGETTNEPRLEILRQDATSLLSLEAPALEQAFRQPLTRLLEGDSHG